MKFSKVLMNKILQILFTLMILVTVSTPVHAIEQVSVRIGVFELGNFLHMDSNGNLEGYYADYINKIDVYTHWNIEYVKVDNWADGLQKLDENKIDIIAPAQKTKEREDKYLFSADSMSTELGAIYTLPKRTELVFDDFKNLKNLKYGAMKNSPITDHFLTDYSKTAGFTPNVVMYDNMNALHDALYREEVDAIATNIMLGDDRVKMIGRYSPSPVYFISKKDEQSKKIMNELDNAMIEVRLNDPTFESTLFSKHFENFSNTQLTLEEMDYIKSLPTINIGYSVNQSPLSYQSGKQYKGITRDILDRVSKYTGIHFNYVPLSSNKIDQNYLRKNKIYVVSDVEYNHHNISVNKMHLSASYFSSESVLVANKELAYDSKSKLKVALSTNSSTIKKIITESYPNFTFKNYDSIDECYKAVEKDEVDASLQNRYVAETHLTNTSYNDLEVVPIKSIHNDLCFATLDLNDETQLNDQINNGLLISCIDKGIKQLTTEDINEIIIKNVNEARYKTTMLDILQDNIIVVILICILIIAGIAFVIYKHRMEILRANELSIKNNELSKAVVTAQKASRAKGDFLARMSHEIRTPMNAIIGEATIAQANKNNDNKVQECISKIMVSSKHLLHLINDILDMSAIENEKINIAHVRFDLKEIVSTVTTVYYSQCREKGINFESKIINTPIEFLIGDQLRLQQCILNLLSNAVKFTEKGGHISFELYEEKISEQDVMINITVEDTGCGMSNEYLNRIFKPFEQESTLTAKEHGGSGLGLSITKNFVELMNGKISVKSKEGIGTKFSLEIPCTIAPDQINLDNSQIEHMKAIIIDDDLDAQQYISNILNHIGINHDCVSSGEIAIQTITKARNDKIPYELCIIDWKMIGMNGVEITRKIRSACGQEPIVIMTSAYDINEIEVEAKEAGVDTCINKPVFQSTLFNALMAISDSKLVQETANINDFDFTGKRLLIVDDTEINREIANDLLTMVGFKIDEACDGKEALEMFEASSPGTYDAVLMDVQMPVMNGYEASKAIRNSHHVDSKSVPIIAMTANAFAEDIAKSLGSGMNDHVSKPIDTELLYKVLERQIGK